MLVNDPTKRDAAYELATKARRTISGDPLILVVLGRVSYERKDFNRAIQLFQVKRARKASRRENPVTAMAQAQAKHKAEAKETSNRALQAGLGDAEEARQNECSRILEELRAR